MLPWLFRAIVVAVVVGGIAVWWQDHQRKAAETEARRIANAATELPAGVETEWMAELDRQFDGIVRIGNRLRLVYSREGMVFAPIDAIAVSCDAFDGISLTYGGGAEAASSVSMTLVGAPRLSGKGLSLGPGVGRRSPAAVALMQKLCEHVTSRLTIMASVRM